MIRNWTGESTEEVFYDLCDEYGMLVWNDFWLSTEGYNLDLNDNQLFMANATEVVKRFRNHASIETKYGKSTNLDDFCKKAQLVNYDSHRAMFESWNSKLWKKASGLLLWMSHSAWPSMVWQTYSWDYETFGSFFGSKKACEPIHIQMNLDDNKVVGEAYNLKSQFLALIK